MKAMGLKSNGLATTQKVQGRAKFPAVRRGKRLSLRWVRTVLMGSERRWRVLLLCLTGFVLSLPSLPSQSTDQAADPWETHPLLLSYLIFTEVSPPRSTEEYECARQELYQTLSLSMAEINQLVQIAAQEYNAFLCSSGGKLRLRRQWAMRKESY
jgi:hypothetical protein